jgi:hypothetical protein
MEKPAQHEILFDDQYLQLYFDPSIKCIVKVWKSPVPEAQFRELIVKLLMQIIQTRMKYQNMVVNLIADCRNLGSDTFTQEVIDWLNQEVHRLYAMNKIKRKAFIASNDVMANMSLVNYISTSNANAGFEMNIFNSMEDAQAWVTKE